MKKTAGGVVSVKLAGYFVEKTKRILALIAILGFCFLIYGRSGSFGTIDLDDQEHVSANPSVVQPSLAGLHAIWTSPYFKLYIPMTYTAWAGLTKVAQVGGKDLSLSREGLFHLANTLIHGLTGGIVFYLIRQLGCGHWSALFGALFFICHPIQVESVAWISGLKDTLSSFFAFLSLWILVKGIEAKRKNWPYFFSSIFYALGILSKPTVVILPFLAVIWLAWTKKMQSSRSLKVILSLWCLCGGTLVFITSSIQGEQVMPFHISYGDRFLVAAEAVIFYGKKIIWPAFLGFDYGMVPNLLIKSTSIWISFLSLLMFFTVVFFNLLPKTLGYAGLFFVFALLPTLGFIPYYYQAISTTADRYVYISMLVPASLMAIWMEKQFSRGKKRLALFAGFLATTILTAQSIRQVSYWRDTVPLARHTLEVNPQSWLAHHILGGALIKGGKIEEGVEHLKATTSMRPWFPDAYFNLGVVAKHQGDFGLAAEYFFNVVRYEPADGRGWFELATVLGTLGRYPEADKAFEKARGILPHSNEFMAEYERYKSLREKSQ